MIKVLFFGRTHREEVWEYDFILNDILPNDRVKKEYFLSLEDIRNTCETFDVFVYSSRDPQNYPWGYIPTYEEVLECVLKIKPKIIINLSDEFIHEDLQEHNNLGNYCELFLRQYHHYNYSYTNNTNHIPLAYKNGFSIDGKVIKKIEDRKYNWSFVGIYKSDRQEMIDNFLQIQNNKCILREESSNEFISSEELIDYFLDSIFIPCSRGWSTIDTMRLYESSISGAIPVIVSSKEEYESSFKYEKNPPWIFADTWENAVKICKDLLEDKEKLQTTQNNILVWWENRIDEIKIKVDDILLFDEYNNEVTSRIKLDNFPSVNFISIEESQDRRDLLYENFQKYNIKNVTPHIYKKYNDEDHKIIEGPIKILPSGRGCTTSHLKAIKEWYMNTEEPYTIFCEDDLSFESVEYWNFTWEEFFNNIPDDWDCVQLCLVRESMFLFFYGDTTFKLRNRCFDDWSTCIFLISRRHAKNLIENYHPDDTIHLEYKGTDKENRIKQDSSYWFLLPTPENLIYSYFSTGKIYSFPLFVENVNQFNSTWTEPGTNWANKKSYEQVIDWWKTKGKEFEIEQLIFK